MSTDAYVLVQSATPGPGAAQNLATALSESGRLRPGSVTPTGGPFDAIVYLQALGPRDLAARVVRLQELDEVGLTLTLPVIETLLDAKEPT